jgi:hypothetical protein
MLFGLLFGAFAGNAIRLFVLLPFNPPGKIIHFSQFAMWLGLAISLIGSVWLSVFIWRSDKW